MSLSAWLSHTARQETASARETAGRCTSIHMTLRPTAAVRLGLRGLATRIVDAVRTALAPLRITAPVWLSHNDGTLMSVEAAERIGGCGPTSVCLRCTRVGWEEAVSGVVRLAASTTLPHIAT